MRKGNVVAAGLVGLIGLAWLGAKCHGCDLGPVDGAYHAISEFMANRPALSVYINPDVLQGATAVGTTVAGFANMGYNLRK